jgi:hypothetical protein
MLDREADARALLESVPDEWLQLDYTVPIWHVANELDEHHKVPRLRIWALKRGAKPRGPDDEAFICWQVYRACRELGAKEVVNEALRTELIPWAEEALRQPGSEVRWQYCLPVLLRAYQEVGETQKAAERQAYWLAEGKRRGVTGLQPGE